MLAATTDTGQAWEKALSGTFRRAVTALSAAAVMAARCIGIVAVGGGPSDLVKLKREASAAAGWTAKRDQANSSVTEQIASHGGHLALSAVTVAAFGVAKPASVSPVMAGTLFGAGLYALAYGVIGPLCGITPKLSRDPRSSIVRHGMRHVMFGITTPLVADRAARRL